MLKAVLIDDEVLALSLLESMLMEIGEVEVVGKFSNPVEGLDQLNELDPDVLFLDIEMAKMTGMKVAESVDIHMTDIIFVTAYDHYALEAYAVQATEYILKPIDKKRLQKAVDRLIHRKRFEKTKPAEEQIIQAQLFGDFQLIDANDKAIKWRTRKVKELCAFLIHKEHAVHRDTVIDSLWPDYPVEKASALLHTTVYQLRKAFKEAAIHQSVQFIDERYKLTVKVETDVDRLKTYVDSGNIEELLNFYTNEYLAKEDYFWSIAKRASIHEDVTNYLKRFMESSTDSMNGEQSYRKTIEKLMEFEIGDE